MLIGHADYNALREIANSPVNSLNSTNKQAYFSDKLNQKKGLLYSLGDLVNKKAISSPQPLGLYRLRTSIQKFRDVINKNLKAENFDHGKSKELDSLIDKAELKFSLSPETFPSGDSLRIFSTESGNIIESHLDETDNKVSDELFNFLDQVLGENKIVVFNNPRDNSRITQTGHWHATSLKKEDNGDLILVAGDRERTKDGFNFDFNINYTLRIDAKTKALSIDNDKSAYGEGCPERLMYSKTPIEAARFILKPNDEGSVLAALAGAVREVKLISPKDELESSFIKVVDSSGKQNKYDTYFQGLPKNMSVAFENLFKTNP